MANTTERPDQPKRLSRTHGSPSRVDAPAPVAGSDDRSVWRLLSPAAALAIITAISVHVFAEWADYDLFWHLELGRNLVERGLTPSPDHLSWSVAGATYLAHSRRVDQILYLLWDVGGFKALAVFSVMATGATLLPIALLLGRLRLRPLIEALALVLVVLADRPFLGARPHVLGFAIFGWLSLMLYRPFSVTRALLTAGLLAVWLNVHATFHVGFLLTVLCCSLWLHERDLRSSLLSAGAILLGAAGTLTAPGGADIWLYPFRTISAALTSRNIDWSGVRPLSQQYLAFGILILLAAAVGLWRARQPLDVAAVLLILPAIQLARFDPFAAPLLARGVFERLRERFPGLADPYPLTRRRAASGWALLAAGVALSAALVPGKPTVSAVVPLPERAVDRLLTCGSPAPVWNDYNWGGYIAWRSDAAYKVSIDGRAEALYPQSVMDDYLQVLDGRIGWQDVVQRSPVLYSIMAKPSPTPIETLPGWRKVYEDAVAVIAARRGAVWRCP